MTFELNLPETAKAISGPVTKSIEVISAGCGKLYEPTGVRRRARADADAMVLIEEGRVRVSEVAERAAGRILHIEQRRQENIEAIVAEAARDLPGEVSNDPVDPDWSVRFFAECQDVSNEEMRGVWARLLAGEVAKPGSFSPRTLSVLKNLTAAEAQHFNALCKHSFRDVAGRVCPLAGIPVDQWWLERNLQIDFAALQRLQDAGLITHHEIGRSLHQVKEFVLVGSGVSLLFATPIGPVDFNLGNVSLTPAGQELAAICEWDIAEERIEEIERSVHSAFKLQRVRVLEVTPQGMKLGPP